MQRNADGNTSSVNASMCSAAHRCIQCDRNFTQQKMYQFVKGKHQRQFIWLKLGLVLGGSFSELTGHYVP